MGRPVFVDRIRENVLLPAPAMPVTTMRLPTIGDLLNSLMALKLLINTPEVEPKAVAEWSHCDRRVLNCDRPERW
jgi:hypothetical protein